MDLQQICYGVDVDANYFKYLPDKQLEQMLLAVYVLKHMNTFIHNFAGG